MVRFLMGHSHHAMRRRTRLDVARCISSIDRIAGFELTKGAPRRVLLHNGPPAAAPVPQPQRRHEVKGPIPERSALTHGMFVAASFAHANKPAALWHERLDSRTDPSSVQRSVHYTML